MVLICAPKVAADTGVAVLPAQYRVQEPGASVCRKARLRYFAWEAFEAAARSLTAVTSTYGAEMWAGKGRPACTRTAL
jgi:hypothetical protein